MVLIEGLWLNPNLVMNNYYSSIDLDAGLGLFIHKTLKENTEDWNNLPKTIVNPDDKDPQKLRYDRWFACPAHWEIKPEGEIQIDIGKEMGEFIEPLRKGETNPDLRISMCFPSIGNMDYDTDRDYPDGDYAKIENSLIPYAFTLKQTARDDENYRNKNFIYDLLPSKPFKKTFELFGDKLGKSFCKIQIMGASKSLKDSDEKELFPVGITYQPRHTITSAKCSGVLRIHAKDLQGGDSESKKIGESLAEWFEHNPKKLEVWVLVDFSRKELPLNKNSERDNSHLKFSNNMVEYGHKNVEYSDFEGGRNEAAVLSGWKCLESFEH